MKRLIVQLRDKTLVSRLNEYCDVIYVSKFLNTAGIEIREERIKKLSEDDNVIGFRESEKGQFQPAGCFC